MEQLGPDTASLARAAELLQQGRLVAVPTETVYGLAANALDEEAARTVFEVKGRPLIDPLIVHFGSLDAALPLIVETADLHALADRFWPGPLTVVVDKRADAIPDIVTAGMPSVAIRVSAHPVLHRLLDQLPFPLAAPSANPFGYLSPTRAAHVIATLGERIAAVIDGGPTRHGVESTIVDLRQGARPRILRPGPIDQQAIEQALGRDCEIASKASASDRAQAAPGQLERHYSPRTALELRKFGEGSVRSSDCVRQQQGMQEPPPKGHAVVLFRRPPENAVARDTYWLSEDGDLEGAAAALFDLLIRLDGAGYSGICVEMAPERGIGIAINDRLRRAAAGTPHSGSR